MKGVPAYNAVNECVNTHNVIKSVLCMEVRHQKYNVQGDLNDER
jgi:hypothetical protein